MVSRRSPLFFLNIGPPAAENISGSLFEDLDTFFQGNVFPAQMFGGVFEETDIFFGGELNLIADTNISGSLLSDADAFNQGQINLQLFGSLFIDADILRHGNVSPQQLFASKLTDADNIFHGTLTDPAQDIGGSLPGDNITVISTVTSRDQISQTSHIVDLPDGSNIVGRLVLVCISADDTPTFTFPASWTEIIDEPGTNVRLGVAYRVIDGTEGFSGSNDTITVTTSNGNPTAHIAYLIENFDSSNIETDTATATNTNPNPPSITPTNGHDNYLILAFQANDTGATTVSIFPSGYTNTQQIQSQATFGCGVASCQLIKATSSEDPGTFTITQTRNWVAATISILGVEVQANDDTGSGDVDPQVFNMDGSLFQEGDTINNGNVYFGVRLSTAQVNRSVSSEDPDPFTIASARPWIALTVSIKGG